MNKKLYSNHIMYGFLEEDHVYNNNFHTIDFKNKEHIQGGL